MPPSILNSQLSLTYPTHAAQGGDRNHGSDRTPGFRLL